MYLKRIPSDQKKWFIQNWCLRKNDSPESIDVKEIKNVLIGESDIRLDDYDGEGQDFFDDYVLSCEAGELSRRKTEQLVTQMAYLMSESKANEFYELYVNIETVLEYLAKKVAQWNHGYLDRQVDDFLKEMNLTVQ